MIKWILFFSLDIFVWYSYSFRAFLIGLSIIFLKYIWDTGLFQGIKFYKGVFKNSEIFYTEYVGEYYQISKEFVKLNLIISKFNLNKQYYSTFGIYYDDPKKVDSKKCRALIGIIKETDSTMRPSALAKDEDLTDYLITNSFKRAILPDSESLVATFPYINTMSMMIGIKKFYSSLDSGLNSEEFKKMYNIDRKKFKFSVEIYRDQEIFFYIPLKNHDKFNLHSIRDNQ
jgi:hypothetical protein